MANPTVASIGAYAAAIGNPTPGIPSGVVEGSSVYLFATNAANGTLTAPAEFELIASWTASSRYCWLWWKRATGAESGTYTVNGPGLQNKGAVALRVIDDDGSADPTGPIDVENTSTSTNTAVVALSGVVSGSLLIWFLAVAGASSDPPAGFTQHTDDVNQRVHVASKPNQAGGDTGNISGTLSTTDPSSTILIAVPPLASPTQGAGFLGLL